MAFDDTFLRSIRKEKVDHIPCWFMRQAGRYQPSYRKVKEKYSLIEITQQPELCAEITIAPIKESGMDAAILYSDIMTPVRHMNIDLDIVAGIGPVIDNPVRTMQDVENMRVPVAEEDLTYVLDTIKILRKELEVPLISFAGAPFTLASYLIEGRPSRDYHKTKLMMYAQPDVWNALMDKLADMIISYMKSHVNAGAQAMQIFDSWIGALSQEDYRRYVYPTMQKIFDGLKDVDVPKILFGVGTGHLLPQFAELQTDVIGLDWRTPINEGRQKIGSQFAVQGNLDPVYLLAPKDVLEAEAARILDLGMEQPGYVFNLGHGIFPEVPVEAIQHLTQFVHDYSARRLAER